MIDADTLGRHLGYLFLGLGWVLVAGLVVTLVALTITYLPLAFIIFAGLFVAWLIGFFIMKERGFVLDDNFDPPPPPLEE